MSEVIVITSGKGGVGKTTTAANLGTALSLENKRTVIVDADIGLRNLDVVMGLENRIVYDIVDVVEGTCKLKQALIKDKRFDNLYLLPAAQTRDKNAVSVEQMSELCEKLKESFDYIIIDCPAGIEQGFRNAIAGANRAIVVTNPEVSAVREVVQSSTSCFAANIRNDSQDCKQNTKEAHSKEVNLCDSGRICLVSSLISLGHQTRSDGECQSNCILTED